MKANKGSKQFSRSYQEKKKSQKTLIEICENFSLQPLDPTNFKSVFLLIFFFLVRASACNMKAQPGSWEERKVEFVRKPTLK